MLRPEEKKALEEIMAAWISWLKEKCKKKGSVRNALMWSTVLEFTNDKTPLTQFPDTRIIEVVKVFSAPFLLIGAFFTIPEFTALTLAETLTIRICNKCYFWNKVNNAMLVRKLKDINDPKPANSLSFHFPKSSTASLKSS